MYHDDAEVIVEWYMAIRSAKLNLLQVAHPTQPEMEVIIAKSLKLTSHKYRIHFFLIPPVGTVIDARFPEGRILMQNGAQTLRRI